MVRNKLRWDANDAVGLSGTKESRPGLELDCVPYHVTGPRKRPIPFRFSYICHAFPVNKPLALRGHVTNASLKQRVVILLMTKI